jgi:recombination protein RecT
MCKKTVLRRLCKLIDLDFDSVEQRKAFEDGSAFDVKGDSQKEVTKAVDPFEEPTEEPESSAEENIIDVEASEVTNAEPTDTN